MAALAYIVLCHGAPDPIVWLTKLLLAADDTGHVVIHYDAKSSNEDFAQLQEAVRESDRTHLVPDRIVCGWGDFSLVDAVVRALRLIRDKSLPCDHVYLLSGSCLPVRPIAQLKRYLDHHPTMEFIQTEPSNWIVGGLRNERYRYYHWVSEIRHKKFFDFCVIVQQLLQVNRRFPGGIMPKFGSQWWCLTVETCYKIIEFIDRHPSYCRFFKKTYIPDEMFFQSLVFELVGRERIFGKPLTYAEFSHQGRASVLFDDNLDLIRRLPHFFARKISPRARQVREYSAEIAVMPDGAAPLPVIHDLPPGVSIRDRVIAQIELPRPGQIFYGDQLSQRGWPGVLRSSTISFGVLYGPPGITQMAAEHLRTVPGLSLFGRIFRRDEVDFGPGGPVFKGLTGADSLIRSADGPLYLSRLLERADGFPVIQIAPGDDSETVDGLWDWPNAVFLSCIPLRSEDEGWQRLYWALSALAPPNPFVADLQRREVGTGSHIFLRRTIDQYIDRFIPRDRRDQLRSRTFGRSKAPSSLRVYFDIESEKHRVVTKRQREQEEKFHALVTAIGPTVLPLLDAIGGINTRLCGLAPDELLDLMPTPWKAYFRVMLEPLPGAERLPAHRASAAGRRLAVAVED